MAKYSDTEPDWLVPLLFVAMFAMDGVLFLGLFLEDQLPGQPWW